MTEIQNLEKQIQGLKKKELYDKWEVYLNKIKNFGEYLKGKSIVSWSTSSSFVIFKVKDFKEKYYIDREGFNGQWSPKRWYEIETDGYLHIEVPKGIFKGKIEQLEHNFIKFFKSGYKKNELEISKLKFHNNSLNKSSWEEISRISKIGYIEYKEYTDDPDYSRALDNYRLFSYIVPDEIYDEAYQIYLDNVQATINFWEKHGGKFNSFKRIEI